MKQANQPFHYTSKDGVDHYVAKGDLFADRDPIVKGREALLDDVPTLDKK